MLQFRTIQALSVATMSFYWAVRFFTNPHHPHITMLIAAALVAITSEVGFRAGRASVKKGVAPE